MRPGDVSDPSRRTARARRVRVAAALGALIFAAAHAPFLPASLEDLDSINFALGVHAFDVANHQPHPPGYPLFIALGKAAHAFVASDARALALLSLVSGALGVLVLVEWYRRIDGGERAGGRAVLAALVAATSPLYWLTASRPLSDVTGLAAALSVQVLTLAAATESTLMVAGFLAALAAGIRSQVVWLTVPLLAWRLLTEPAGRRGRLAVRVLAAFVAGGLVWGVPLVALTGGPAAYWRVLFAQGAEDLSGVRMLWTTPTLQELVAALNYAFLAPWAVVWVGGIVLGAAVLGLARLWREQRSTLIVLSVACGPYLLFDLLFQETVTTRYALPLVVPIAYLAVAGASWLPVRLSAIAVVVLAACSARVGVTSLAEYAREPAPAFRMLGDLQAVHTLAPALRPVLAMHRREAFDLRRPIAWLGSAMPPVDRQLAAPPKHEWLEMVKYWNEGGRDLVWFVADPLRTDLALVDHGHRPNGSYRWPLSYPILLGGVRPDSMDWFALQPPGWYLGEGWALTPETAGLAQEDGKGPGRAPIVGWIRRRPEAAVLMIGGRNLSLNGPVAHAWVAIDGRTIDELSVAPGFFLKTIELPAGALTGSGDYATITIGADSDRFAIEQFDAQSADRVVAGYDEGWQEPEYKPSTGLLWRWMSERAVVRVHTAGRDAVLTLNGEPPSIYFSRPSRVRVSAGGRVLYDAPFSDSLALQVRIPAELLPAGDHAITIESDQMYVPAERSWRSRDLRHLALRVYQLRVDPAS